MGYCTYTVRPSDGAAAAAWIGTGTDQGRNVTVSYAPGSCTPPSSQRCKDLRCNDARNQFCKKYGCTQVPVGGNCAKRSISENEAAALILNAAEDYCNIGNVSASQTQLALNNAKKYQNAITTIKNALARGDCVTASNTAYSAGKAFASSYGCAGLYYGGPSTPATGGGSTKTPATGPDSDCSNYLGLGGALDGVCVAGKSLLKGGTNWAQDPVGRYMPLFLLGGGLFLLALLIKR